MQQTSKVFLKRCLLYTTILPSAFDIVVSYKWSNWLKKLACDSQQHRYSEKLFCEQQILCKKYTLNKFRDS